MEINSGLRDIPLRLSIPEAVPPLGVGHLRRVVSGKRSQFGTRQGTAETATQTPQDWLSSVFQAAAMLPALASGTNTHIYHYVSAFNPTL